MEQKNTHILYGVGTGVVTVILSLIAYMAKVDLNPIVAWLIYLPVLVGLILNAFAFAKANNGYVTFKSVYGSCFKQTMIFTLIMVVWVLITIYAFPEKKEEFLRLSREQMLKQPDMTDEKIDIAMTMAKKMYGTLMVSGTLFGYLFIGAILSLIAAALPKKKGEQIFTADNF